MELDERSKGTVRCGSWIKRPENAHLVVLGRGKLGHKCPALLEILAFDPLTASLSPSPKATHKIEEGGDPISIAVHPSGDDIVCSTSNGSCELLELYGGQKNIKLVVKELPPLQGLGLQNCITFSADGSKFATGGADGHLRVFEWPSLRIIIDEPNAHKSFRDMDFSLDSELLASISTDGSARIWNTSEAISVTSLARNSDEKIELCRFSKDGSKPFLFCTIQKGGKALTAVWDIRTWKKIGHKRLLKKPAAVMSTSLDGKYISLGSKDGDFCVIEVKEMEVSHWSRRLHPGTCIMSMEFCPSERIMLTTSEEWGVIATKLNVPADWKEWQIYMLLLGLFLASAVAFFIFFKNSDSFWNFPLGPDQPAKPKVGAIFGEPPSSDDQNMQGPFGPLDMNQVMHAIKCGLASQISAMARCNDPLEKKSRVRMSKKERKVLVESFIKTFQDSNNGTFPSLHLTHKEVGGSYYVVREIVRDIIQENKVLGPSKLLQQEQESFKSLRDMYPLGCISKEPQIPATFPPNGTHSLDQGASAGELIFQSEELTDQCLDNNLSTYKDFPYGNGEHSDQCSEDSEVNQALGGGGSKDSEGSMIEATVNTSEEYMVEAGQADGGPFINGNAVKKLEGSQDVIDQIEVTGRKQEVEESKCSKGMVSQISEAVEVETFPSQVSITPSQTQEASSGDTLTLIDDETVHIDLDSSSPNSNVVKKIVVATEQGNKTEELTQILENSTVKKHSHGENGIEADVKGSDTQEVVIFHSRVPIVDRERSEELAASKPAKIPATSSIKNLSGTRSRTGSKTSEQETVKAKLQAAQSSLAHQKISKPTMDRINLESCEETTRQPAHDTSSPFSVFVKACVDAFLKLWSN